jgi:hypothetical protein
MGPQFIADAQKATDFYTSSKMLKKPYKISDVIDRSLIEKVSKSVKVPPEWNKCS